TLITALSCRSKTPLLLPPPERVRVPVCTETVPVLLSATPTLAPVVPPPAPVFWRAPALLTAAAPAKKLPRLLPFCKTSVLLAPLVQTAPLLKVTELPASAVAVPSLSTTRPLRVALLSRAVPTRTVCPGPLSVPPDQVHCPWTVTVPAPLSVPPDWV